MLLCALCWSVGLYHHLVYEYDAILMLSIPVSTDLHSQNNYMTAQALLRPRPCHINMLLIVQVTGNDIVTFTVVIAAKWKPLMINKMYFL